MSEVGEKKHIGARKHGRQQVTAQKRAGTRSETEELAPRLRRWLDEVIVPALVREYVQTRVSTDVECDPNPDEGSEHSNSDQRGLVEVRS